MVCVGMQASSNAWQPEYGLRRVLTPKLLPWVASIDRPAGKRRLVVCHTEIPAKRGCRQTYHAAGNRLPYAIGALLQTLGKPNFLEVIILLAL